MSLNLDHRQYLQSATVFPALAERFVISVRTCQLLLPSAGSMAQDTHDTHETPPPTVVPPLRPGPLARIEDGLLVIALLLSAALPLIDVVGRPLGGFHVPGGAAYLQLLTLWLAFLGGLVATREKEHLTLSTAELIGSTPGARRRSVLFDRHRGSGGGGACRTARRWWCGPIVSRRRCCRAGSRSGSEIW